MADGEQVMIYATGGDSDLREMCGQLLLAGLAEQADLLDRARFYLKNGDTPKVGWSGRAVLVICQRDKLDEVLSAMKRSYYGDDLAAYAVPVVARI
jgi:hypothetical protein